MVPLPATMLQQATAAQALVGASPVTGTCAPADPTDPEEQPTDVPIGPDGLPSGNLPSGGPSSGIPSGSNARSGGGGGGTTFADVLGPEGSGGPADGGPGEEDEVALAEIAYPDPSSGGGSNGLATGLALVVLAVLAAVGGMLSSGRRRSLPGRTRP